MANELGTPSVRAAAIVDLGLTSPVIDLGDDFHPLASSAAIRVRNRRGRRAVVWLATVAITAFGVAAAGPVPAGPLRAAARLNIYPGATAMVVDDILYVSELRSTNKELVAYRLDTGQRLWRTRLTTTATTNSLYRAGSTILIAYQGDGDLHFLTDGVDLASGRLLWRSTAGLMDVRSGRVIMATLGPTPDEEILSRLDPRTGATVWSRTVGYNCASDLGDTYVELCPRTAELQVIDLDSGAIRATRRLDLAAASPGDESVFSNYAVTQAGGVVFAGYPTDTAPVMGGFDGTDLRPLWSRPFFPQAIVSDCGDVFCLYDSSIDTAVNVRTGADLPFPGFQAIRYRGLPSPDVGSGPVDLSSRHALIPEGARPDRRGNYPGATALVEVADSAPVRVPSTTNLDTFIASVDPVSGHMTILQRLHHVGVQSCVGLGTYLGCSEEGAWLQFWHLASGPADD